jgi:hypothetical protein
LQSPEQGRSHSSSILYREISVCRGLVVGLRGLELRANHAVAIEPISGRRHLADFVRSNVAELPKNTPEKDWQSAAKGAVLSEIPGA